MTLRKSNNTAIFMRYLIIVLVIIMVDQISKIWIIGNLELHHSFPVFSGFSIVHAHNYGAAFGFLNSAGGAQTVIFSGIAMLVSLVLVVWLYRISGIERQLSFALSFVLGGALGNLIDRLQYNYVVDFLLFYYDRWQFPAFNVADSAIFIGAVLLLLDSFEIKLIPDSGNKKAIKR